MLFALRLSSDDASRRSPCLRLVILLNYLIAWQGSRTRDLAYSNSTTLPSVSERKKRESSLNRNIFRLRKETKKTLSRLIGEDIALRFISEKDRKCSGSLRFRNGSGGGWDVKHRAPPRSNAPPFHLWVSYDDSPTPCVDDPPSVLFLRRTGPPAADKLPDRPCLSGWNLP